MLEDIRTGRFVRMNNKCHIIQGFRGDYLSHLIGNVIDGKIYEVLSLRNSLRGWGNDEQYIIFGAKVPKSDYFKEYKNWHDYMNDNTFLLDEVDYLNLLLPQEEWLEHISDEEGVE